MHVWHRDLAVVEHCHAGTGAVMWPTKKKTSKYFHRRHRNEKRGGGEEKACLLQPAFNHFYRRVARAPTRARQHKEKEEEAA